MLKYIETTGKNEEEAIAAALRKLGMDRDDVSVEILERAKSGFLGIGGTPAKVKVTYEVPDEPVVAPVAEPAPVVEEAPAVEEKEEAVSAPVAVACEEPDEEVKQKIESFLNGLMHHMFVNAEVKVRMDQQGT